MASPHRSPATCPAHLNRAHASSARKSHQQLGRHAQLARSLCQTIRTHLPALLVRFAGQTIACGARSPKASGLTVLDGATAPPPRGSAIVLA